MFLLQLSDPHIGPHPDSEYKGVHTRLACTRALEAALRAHPEADALLITGDLAAQGHPDAYAWLATTLARLGLPVYCLPGNHDDPETLHQRLRGETIAAPDWFDLGPWRIVCADSSRRGAADGWLSPDACRRIDAALAANTARYVLLALHHHPIASGSAWLDALGLSNPADLFELIARRRQQVRGVLFGHVHQAIDELRDGLRFLSCPSTCIQFKRFQQEFTVDTLPPGYRWLQLHDDGSFDTATVDVPLAG
jgi:Icc protein